MLVNVIKLKHLIIRQAEFYILKYYFLEQIQKFFFYSTVYYFTRLTGIDFTENCSKLLDKYSQHIQVNLLSKILPSCI